MSYARLQEFEQLQRSIRLLNLRHSLEQVFLLTRFSKLVIREKQLTLVTMNSNSLLCRVLVILQFQSSLLEEWCSLNYSTMSLNPAYFWSNSGFNDRTTY